MDACGGPSAGPDPPSVLRRAGLGPGLVALAAGTVGVAMARPELRDPLVDLLLGLVPQDAVALLDLADQRVLLRAHVLQVGVGELGPLGLHLRRELLPFALNTVPVHVVSSLIWGMWGAMSAARRRLSAIGIVALSG